MLIDYKDGDSEILYPGNSDSIVRIPFQYVLVTCMDVVIGRAKSAMCAFSEIKTCNVHPVLCECYSKYNNETL